MRRALIGRGTTARHWAVQDTTGGAETGQDDWAARHARLRSRSEDTHVRADAPTDDWSARHGRTRRD